MTIPPLCFPRDLLRFFYWILFRPRTLERYLRHIDPNYSSRTSVFSFFYNNRRDKYARHLLRLAFFYILIFPWVFTFVLLALLALMGGQVHPDRAVIGLVGALLFSIVGNLVYSMKDGVIINLVISISTGLVCGAVLDGDLSPTINVAMGLAAGVAFGTVWDEVWGVAGGLGWGIGLGVLTGVSSGPLVGTVCCLTFWFTYFRLWFYGFEAFWSFYLSRSRPEDFQRSPVVWDELIWLPLPGLDRQLVVLAQKDRKQGFEAIAQVWASFRQGWAARTATLELLATSIASGRTLQQILHTVEMVSLLPNSLRIEFTELLSGLEQIGRYTRSIQQEETPTECLALLRSAHALAYRLRSLASVRNSHIPRPFAPALTAWEAIFEHEMEKILIPERPPEGNGSFQ